MDNVYCLQKFEFFPQAISLQSHVLPPSVYALQCLYKILNNKYDIRVNLYLEQSQNTRTRGHQSKSDTNPGQWGHLRLGCATHLPSEQSVIGTSSLLLLLSRRIQLPSKLSWPDLHLLHVVCHNPLPPLAWYSTRRSGHTKKCEQPDIGPVISLKCGRQCGQLVAYRSAACFPLPKWRRRIKEQPANPGSRGR